ncbi:prenyltransferase/squalene oxidase repeat-containing protein [Nocardia sp. BMG51109]|uniref:prenyltransferase/squalene oxidase repeat-containing protein n=1 Tax=Nocardia sp. BMG51109 TaxID=1056816 RepID=UPI000466D077|nr:prenyltransferase/squalene oxidase repeat-containing protein [Nocardia sp. BMG51109]
MLASSLYVPPVTGTAPEPVDTAAAPAEWEPLARLRAHVIGHVGDDGAVRDRCGSRVLESCLLLYLLRAEGIFEDTQRGIVEYLETHRADPPESGAYDPEVAAVEQTLVSALLGESGASRVPLEAIDRYRHFTSPRKRFMFHTLFTELSVADSDVPFDLAAVRYDSYATWVNLEMCALKIMRAHQQGEPGAVTDADRTYLLHHLATGSDRSVFEADIFAHAVGLLGLRRIDPASPMIRSGLEALLRCQNPDGGFPFIAGWEPFGTAVCGLALAHSGADPAVVTSMAEYLVRTRSDDGGWAFAPRVRQSDADCTPYCLELLRATNDERFDTAIRATERYLLELVNSDGGFGTYRYGDDSEVGVTGSAVSALEPLRHNDATSGNGRDHAAILDGAVRYLLHKQQTDGTFERGWSASEANAMFRALFAFRHYRSGPPDELRESVESAAGAALRYFRRTQNPDGGWGQRPGDRSDVLSTSYSLLALTCCDTDPAVVRKGTDWLVAQQHRDGGFSSRPDSAGPRPFPHDLPVLADGFALLALAYTGGRG